MEVIKSIKVKLDFKNIYGYLNSYFINKSPLNFLFTATIIAMQSSSFTLHVHKKPVLYLSITIIGCWKIFAIVNRFSFSKNFFTLTLTNLHKFY